MILYYFKSIYESLKFNSFRTFLTGIGILIGISSLVVIFTISDSFASGLTSKFNNGSVSIGLINSVSVSDDISAVLKMPEVKKTIDYVSKDMDSVISFTQDKSEKLIDYIYDNKLESSVQYAFSNDVVVDEGEDFNNRTGNVVIVRNSNEFDNKIKIGTSLIIYGVNYTVIGYTSQEDKEGIPILYFPEDKKNIIRAVKYEESPIFELVVRDDAKSEVVNEVIKKLNESVPEGYKFTNISEEVNKSVKEAVSSISVFIVLISGISIIVASINVANIMYISILERTNEVAIYRALGMKKIEVEALFLLESILIVLSFSVIGYIFGMFISYVILTILKMDIIIKFTNIIIVVILSMLIGVLAGFRPARKAANVNTATILK